MINGGSNKDKLNEKRIVPRRVRLWADLVS